MYQADFDSAAWGALKTEDEMEQQIARVRIHRSLEKARITPVFGTPSPPKGLSGLIRNYAYRRFSEAQLRHWLLLMLADRIDVIESFLADLVRRRIPRFIREVGVLLRASTTPLLSSTGARA